MTFTVSGTSLFVTVIRSFGNNHSHLGMWCWTQTGLKGKARTVFFLGVMGKMNAYSFFNSSLLESILTSRLLQAVHFLTFYAPLWGAILYNGFTYFQVIRMLRNARRVCNPFVNMYIFFFLSF